MALAELDSGEALGRVLDSPEWAKILSEFQSYVTDLPSLVLGAVATGEDPPRPTPQGLGEARERETVAPRAATRLRVSASADWVIRMGLSTHPPGESARRARRSYEPTRRTRRAGQVGDRTRTYGWSATSPSHLPSRRHPR